MSVKDILTNSDISESFFSRVFFDSSDMFALSRLTDGVFVEVNQTFCHSTGYQRETIINQSDLDLALWQENSARDFFYSHLREHGQIRMGNVQINHKAGHIIYLSLNANIIQIADEVLIVTVLREQSESNSLNEALMLSEEKFSSAFHHSSDFMMISEYGSGLILDVNQQFTELTGYHYEEACGKTTLELDLWVDMEERKAMYEAIKSDGKISDMEIHYRLKSGAIHTAIISVSPIQLNQQKVLITVARDSTEQNKMALALKRSEEKFAKAFESTPDAILITSLKDGRFIEANHACEVMFGYNAEKNLGKTVHNLDVWVDPAARERLTKLISEQGKARNFQAQMRRRDGEIMDVLLSSDLIELDGEQCMVNVTRDVSQVKKVMAELQASEEKFSSAFHGSTDVMVIIRPATGLILDVNQRFTELTGHEREYAIGRSTLEINAWADLDERDEFYRELADKGYVYNMPAHLVSCDGMIWDYEVSANVISIANEPALNVVCRNVSQQKQAERELILSEEKFSRAFQSSPDSITITTLEDGKIIEVNNGFERLFGYTRSQAIGNTTVDLLLWKDDRDREKLTTMLQRQNRVVDWEVKLCHANASVIDTIISGDIIILNKQACILMTVRDITMLKRAEQELALAATTFNSHDSIMIIDRDANILRVNPAFCRTTGYASEEVIGRTPEFLQSGHHSKKFYRKVWQQLRENGRWEGEIWDRHKNGEVFPQWETISAVKDETGKTTHYVSIMRDITERKKAEEQIERLAFFDDLTRLPNRRLLMDRMEHDLHSAMRRSESCALLFIDLDHFKTLNDSLGHAVGDALLEEVARRLSATLRDGDTAARHGGDEFVVLLLDLGQDRKAATENTLKVVNKLQKALSRPYDLHSYQHHISLSIGIAMFPDDADDRDNLLKFADTAMYRAKEAGRNTLMFYHPDMQTLANNRLEVEKDLRQVLERAELRLFCQPQFNATGEIEGMEALLRWQHPDKGLLNPDTFISVAEDTGMIIGIGGWVLRESCRQMKDWLDEGLVFNELVMGVNVSPKQFRHADFVYQVESIINETGIPPQHLMLEITEGIVIDDIPDTITKITALKRLGVRFSIDDFGTGYSSLSYLKRLPLDQLKVAEVFVRDITTDPSDAVIVETIIGMAHHLGLQVIAEGVESEAELNFLRSQGCKLYQGFFFSPPLPISEIRPYLQNRTR